MKTLAIDPGPQQSAYVIIDDTLKPIWYGKLPNHELINHGHLYAADHVAIEMVPPYGTGLAAGKDIYNTCVWIGRFWQAIIDNETCEEKLTAGGLLHENPTQLTLVPRTAVKAHICGHPKAKDPNVVQALIDRFAPNTRNYGKGIKNDPGYFYGFHTDIWQAYALAVYYNDTQLERTPA